MIVLPQFNEFRTWIGLPPPKKESGAVTELRERFNSYHYHNVYNYSKEYRVAIMLYVDLRNESVRDLIKRSLDKYKI